MNSAKILIVEDETIVALDIKSAMKKLGHEVVDTVTNYDDAMACVKNHEIDIILMDINLDNSAKDGIETAKDIKKIKNIPVLYLTAYSDDETIQRAVKTNPIGYLTKPFKREELKSTIALSLFKARETNIVNVQEDSIELGFGYFYDFGSSKLSYNYKTIKLGEKEHALLRLLIDARGNVVKREDIEHNLWTDRTVKDSTIRTLIYRLNTKLEHKIVDTVTGYGCKLTTKF